MYVFIGGQGVRIINHVYYHHHVRYHMLVGHEQETQWIETKATRLLPVRLTLRNSGIVEARVADCQEGAGSACT